MQGLLGYDLGQRPMVVESPTGTGRNIARCER
jgi:hypothetical protein